MTTNEFLSIRSKVKPLDPVVSDDTDLATSSQYRTVIAPSGNLVQVEIKVDDEVNNIPYTTYDQDFLLQHGITGLGELPLSSFAVYDKLSEITNAISTKTSKTE